MSVANFFSKEEKNQIVQAIKDAEKETSGEIRVHLDLRRTGPALDQAVKTFSKLKMHRTQLRNGTLIYIAVKDHKFAIFGDEGINKIVPENFWEDVKEEMQAFFVKGQFADGVSRGVYLVGEKLKAFFPHQKDDINELGDDISLGE